MLLYMLVGDIPLVQCFKKSYKISRLGRGLNPQPLDLETTVLTTRPPGADGL